MGSDVSGALTYAVFGEITPRPAAGRAGRFLSIAGRGSRPTERGEDRLVAGPALCILRRCSNYSCGGGGRRSRSGYRCGSSSRTGCGCVSNRLIAVPIAGWDSCVEDIGTLCVVLGCPGMTAVWLTFFVGRVSAICRRSLPRRFVRRLGGRRGSVAYLFGERGQRPVVALISYIRMCLQVRPKDPVVLYFHGVCHVLSFSGPDFAVTEGGAVSRWVSVAVSTGLVLLFGEVEVYVIFSVSAAMKEFVCTWYMYSVEGVFFCFEVNLC